MIPILYATMNEGTVPSHHGLGELTDAVSVSVTEQRNGSYELSMVYPSNGIHAEDIAPNTFIKAKPNYTDDPQIFRIYKVGKEMNGKFTVNAQHISYDLSGKVIEQGSANSCVSACSLLATKSGNFSITTDKTVSGNFTIIEPSSVRSWFGGKAGSLLDVFGTGEWSYNNYSCTLKASRGSDRGVTIRYGKNLTQLSQVLDISNLVTGVIPFFIDSKGNKTIGAKVSTGLVLDTPRDKAIDFSTDCDPESATPIVTQLSNLATNYIANNNLTIISNNITLDFVQLEGLTERIDLCDTVHIYFEPLGITASAKCIETVWDVLMERYTKTTFGDPKTNIADTIASNSKDISERPSYSAMQTAINNATELITGNMGGYVVLHDSNGDGEPDEILIMDTADITTATKVWRWNKNGLGYSSTGYAGTYGTAITQDGQIVANYITTGTLNADLIKAGTIEDVNHNSSIDMTSGEAILKNVKAKNVFYIIDNSNVTRGSLGYTGTNGTELRLKSANGNDTLLIQAKATSGGYVGVSDNNGTTVGSLQNSSGSGILALSDGSNNNIYLYGSSGNLTAKGNAWFSSNLIGLSKSTYGGNLVVKNNAETTVINNFVGSSSEGELYIGDSGGTHNVYLHGGSGNITCVSLTQTSSIKTKKNIEPISDAEKILELKPVKFDFKNEEKGTDQRGFIAEEVAEVLPNLVTNGETPSLNYVGMIPYLVEIIKKHEARIKALEDIINGNTEPKQNS